MRHRTAVAAAPLARVAGWHRGYTEAYDHAGQGVALARKSQSAAEIVAELTG
jgi:hypothetical protein